MRKLKYDKLTIYEVEDLHKKILKDLKKEEGDLRLDFTSIQKIDMTGIQLLLSTKKTCETQSKKLILMNLSEGVKESVKLSGCDLLLGVEND